MQPLLVDAAPPPSLRRSLASLLLLALALAVGFCMMQSFGIMAESAKRDIGLSDTTLAIVQGVGNAVPLVLFSVPVGILVDRTRRIRLLIVMALTWTLGTFATAMAPDAEMLFVSRMLVGIGTTGGLTAALSLSADLCLPEQRGRGLLITNVGKMIGTAAGFALAGWLLARLGTADAPQWMGNLAPWRQAQLGLGLLSAVLLVPLLWLREPARHEVEAGPNATFRQGVAELWARRAFLVPLFIGQTSVVMADTAAGIWASPVLERVYHQQPGEFGQWLGAITLATGIVGAIIGGAAADWGQASARRGGLLIGAVVAAAIGTPAALFPIMPDVTGFAVMIGIFILAGTVTGLVTSVALTVMLPNEVRGLAIGLFIAIAGLIGFGIAPVLVTLASGAMGGEGHIASALALVGTVVSLVSTAAFWLAMRRAPAPGRGLSGQPI